MTTYEIKRPITIMMDELILEQLPKKVRKQLGDTIGTGFHLGETRRDYTFENGAASYKLGSNIISVGMDS